ncbi:RNA-binding protein [bacterium]|nr:RNA-binding protein [bacterium]
MKLYVGNLPYTITDADLQKLFEEFGPVSSAFIIVDKMNNNRSKGFGFVEMSDEDAKKAIAALDQKDFNGRNLIVNEARPQVER